MSHLSIAALGILQIYLDGQPARGFTYNKARALLAYLAVEADRPHGRDEIVGLLWPDLPEAAARSNLRQALADLRAVIGDTSTANPFLIITRDTIQFNAASDYELDVAAFTTRLDLCARHPHRHIERCPACAVRLLQVAALYRGDLLSQFFVVDAAPFEEWLLLKREALHQRTAEALAHLAAHYAAWHDLAHARETIARQIELDPWREEAHAHLMRLLAQQGQRTAALNQYEICRRCLAEQLSVEPSLETRRLYEHIRDEVEDQAIAQSVRRVSSSTMTLIGRETELSEIGEWLSHPARRLITVTGPGGIGKTCLALAAAEANDPIFADGAWFVALASVDSADRLASAILAALKVPLEPQLDPNRQLLAHLREREILLVLDNFEHLLNGSGLVADILQQAPRVALLITSRERLALQTEWVFELEGLSYPAKEIISDLEQYSAVRLFVDRARQTRRRFQLTGDDATAVARICRIVEGLPLAIELAAAAAADRSCMTIAANIETGARQLAAQFRDMPERHRSLWATFEQSWQLLNEDERRVFSRLAVFHGGFRVEAAEQVAQATPEMLSKLAKKSLLRYSAERFDLHDLLRQYAAEKLGAAPAESVAAGSRHGAYYLHVLKDLAKLLSSAQQATAFATLTGEGDNIRNAWQWMVSHQRWDMIQSSALELMSWCDYQLYYADSYHLFADAIQQLQIGSTPAAALGAERASAEGRVLTAHGYFLWCLGQNERARRDLHSGFERLRLADDEVGLADNSIGLGAVFASLGQLDLAAANFEESSALYRRLNDRTGQALAALQLGIVDRARGHYLAAYSEMEHAIAEYRQIGDQKMVANSLGHYGRLLVLMGQPEQARAPLQESLTISQTIGDRWSMGGAMTALGQVEYTLGNFQEAKRVLAHGVRELSDLNAVERLVDAINWLGQAELALSEHAKAQAHWLEGLRLSWQSSLVRCQLDALFGLAQLYARDGQVELAFEIALYAHSHPAIEQSTRQQADSLQASLVKALIPQQIEAIQKWMQTRSLDDLIARILEGSP